MAYVVPDDWPDLTMTVGSLFIGVRAYNCLHTLFDCPLEEVRHIPVARLANCTAYDLLRVKNLGRKTYWEIVDAINACGYRLKPVVTLEQ